LNCDFYDLFDEDDEERKNGRTAEKVGNKYSFSLQKLKTESRQLSANNRQPRTHPCPS